MARQNKEFSTLPTAKIRAIIWTRTVKKALLPNKATTRPYAHLIEPALNDFIHAHNLKNNKKGVQSFDDVAVSRGRWMDWWSGSQPSPSKIKVFSKVSPNSEKLFTSQISYYPDNPIHSLLYAIDLWASKTDQRNKAYGLIFAIEKAWGPTHRKSKNNVYQGWVINPFPDKELPAELVFFYKVLEPSSLVKFMLLVGDYLKIDETNYFERWVFDLACVALATRAIINPNYVKASALGGETVDLTTLIERMFITKNNIFRDKPDAFESTWRGRYEDSMQVSNQFYNLIRKSTELIYTKLAEIGIREGDINALCANFFWIHEAYEYD